MWQECTVSSVRVKMHGRDGRPEQRGRHNIILEEGGLSARGKGGGIMFVLNRKEKERGRKKEICFNSVLTFGYLK